MHKYCIARVNPSELRLRSIFISISHHLFDAVPARNILPIGSGSDQQASCTSQLVAAAKHSSGGHEMTKFTKQGVAFCVIVGLFLLQGCSENVGKNAGKAVEDAANKANEQAKEVADKA
jgi:hypothetical protein